MLRLRKVRKTGSILFRFAGKIMGIKNTKSIRKTPLRNQEKSIRIHIRKEKESQSDSLFQFYYARPIFTAKLCSSSEMWIVCGQTFSQLRQAMQHSGCFSASI